MKHSLLLYLAIPAFVLTLVSCSKDSPDYGDEVIIEGDYRKPSSLADGEKIAFPAWVSEGLSKDFADAVKGRLKETAPSADNAQVIVTDMAGYSGLDTLKGRVVVVCDPSKILLEQLGVEAGNFLCVAFQQGRSGHCAVRTPAEGLEVDECLNGLVSWTNNAILNVAGNFDPSSFWEESCLYTTYSDKVSEKITNVAASKHDYLEGEFSIDVQLKVTPMHGFKSGDSEAMDYYLMTSTVSVVSGKMYTGNFTKTHGLVKARICGFYLKSLSSNIYNIKHRWNSSRTFCPDTDTGDRHRLDRLHDRLELFHRRRYHRRHVSDDLIKHGILHLLKHIPHNKRLRCAQQARRLHGRLRLRDQQSSSPEIPENHRPSACLDLDRQFL